MTQDYATITLDRLLQRSTDQTYVSAPIDPAMRTRLNQLVGELSAINFRRPAER
jgi:hypothetical protein